jgi:hypothetical protein
MLSTRLPSMGFGTQMSNSSLRKRLGIKDSIGDGLIKPYGEQNSKKAAKYVPFWA